MNAVDYLKAKGRMTNGCKYGCDECLLSSDNNGINRGCAIFEVRYPEKAIEIVEKWVKENPVKTYLSVLLEKFPNIPLNDDGTPKFCPTSIWNNIGCIRCRNSFLVMPCNTQNCWNREYKEGDK